jgi:hypothetical protein
MMLLCSRKTAAWVVLDLTMMPKITADKIGDGFTVSVKGAILKTMAQLVVQELLVPEAEDQTAQLITEDHNWCLKWK